MQIALKSIRNLYNYKTYFYNSKIKVSHAEEWTVGLNEREKEEEKSSIKFVGPSKLKAPNLLNYEYKLRSLK